MGTELSMSIKTEEILQTGSQTLPSSGVADGTRSHKHWLTLVIAAIAVVALLASGIWSRVKARSALSAETAQVALTAVSVVSPKPTASAQEIILPGNVQPFITSPIYSRTNGYLKK
jgi:hypothetical protein